MWRPDGWYKMKWEAMKDEPSNDGFEAGADAMYNAIKEQLTNYWSSMDLMYTTDRIFKGDGD